MSLWKIRKEKVITELVVIQVSQEGKPSGRLVQEGVIRIECKDGWLFGIDGTNQITVAVPAISVSVASIEPISVKDKDNAIK